MTCRQMDMESFRRATFRVYVRSFLGVVAIVATLFLTVTVGRGLFSWSYVLLVEGIPKAAIAVWNDWLLIPAFIIAGLFVWSVPWGDIFGTSSDRPVTSFRRGRYMNTHDSAAARAHQDLWRRRAAQKARAHHASSSSESNHGKRRDARKRPRTLLERIRKALRRIFRGPGGLPGTA